ncbi:maleylpyruvate isomerase N-terminal domain-containing protein [Streptomyces sp. NPDC047002]|uniref:maleylpyruvate isomerase N-terminal domain-containing protein n=1 Tax=Streptomyces sp. NPDC047002 TaxID=3155475 RepID=UPI003452121D
MDIGERPLLLTERTGLDAGPEVVREVLRAHRGRLLARLAPLDGEAWAAPTRCADWSVHHVVRHLVDMGGYDVARLAERPELARYEGAEPFRPARTPRTWLARSADRTPAQTLADLRAVADEEDRCFAWRIAASAGRPVREADLAGALPNRPMLWSARALHVLWDAWLHERDLEPVLGPPAAPGHPETVRLVTLYGLLLAAGMATRTGHVPAALVTAGGACTAWLIGGSARDVTVAEVPAPRPPGSSAARTGPPGGVPALHASTAQELLDSLSGRGAPLAEVLSGPAGPRDALGLLAAAMNR